MTRNSRIEEMARYVGLIFRTWSPGDGVTRYRFFDGPADNYFAEEDGLWTARGAKEAEVWLRGFTAGRRAGRRSG